MKSEIKNYSSSSDVADLSWVKKKEWPRQSRSKKAPLKLVDLFCSCGGMTLGVWEGARSSKRGVSVKLAIDIQKSALDVYKKNFDKWLAYPLQEKVENVFPGERGEKIQPIEREWLKKVGHVDLLVAGPPCQGHSDLNNSTRRDDPRNSLYLRVARAAEILQPKVVVIENVPTVLRDKKQCVGLSLIHI